jgi:hypothetical protein
MFGVFKGMLASVGIGDDHWEKIMITARHIQARADYSYSIYPSNEFKVVFLKGVELTNEIMELDGMSAEKAGPYYDWLEKLKYHQNSLELMFNLKSDVDEEFERRSKEIL